jgi:transcriptional regulator with XRE-family HTH domain
MTRHGSSVAPIRAANADLLRAWRRRRGYSRPGLARLLMCSPRTLQEWEQRRRAGPPGRIIALALAGLDREIDETGETHPTPHDHPHRPDRATHRPRLEDH